jgi:hypothetical protein
MAHRHRRPSAGDDEVGYAQAGCSGPTIGPDKTAGAEQDAAQPARYYDSDLIELKPVSDATPLCSWMCLRLRQPSAVILIYCQAACMRERIVTWRVPGQATLRRISFDRP